MKTELWAMAAVLVASFIGSFGALFMKKAAHEMRWHIRSLFNRKFILGSSLYILSTVIFIIALHGGELSVLYPLIATVYIWVAVLSMRFLGEKMNRWKWASVLIITLGIIFIGIGS